MDKFLEMKRKFEAVADPKKAQEMAKYMRHLFPFYGIPTKERRMLYRDFLKEEKRKGEVDWDFLDQCYQAEKREFQYLVYDYLLAMSNKLIYEDIPHIKTYIVQKEWWDTIDFFDQVIGKIGLKDDRVDALMLEWSQADDFWLRRIAIDYQLGRKEKTNVTLLEQIIVNNFDSKEFFIQKAIGWSLRDYSKTNPLWVKNFIETYRNRLAPLSIREGSKYI